MSKSTLLEQSVTMYSLADNNIKYWNDWARHFIQCCEEFMGWKVERGPGTSLGSIVTGIVYSESVMYGTYRYKKTYGSSSWDCDWTQTNGIPECWKDSLYDNNPQYHSWFYEQDIWPANSDEYGLDDTIGRFDFIVYTGENENGEKVGFRVKYPVCSVGYTNSNHKNILYTVPVFSVYSSTRGNIDLLYNNSSYMKNEKQETNIFDGYIYLFEKNYYNYTHNGRVCLCKSDINDTINGTSQESYQWNLNLQTDDNFPYSVDHRKQSVQMNRLFKNYWKNYNKFYYQFSKTQDTSYFYVANSLNDMVGIKIITTTLENGEKAVLIERHSPDEVNCLCESCGSTYTENYSPSQEKGNILIRMPLRPYTKISSQINRFTLSKLLIPTKKTFCTDLYYVTKRDSEELIGEGTYIIVKDKLNEKHYFRIVPFGSRYTYEVSGDNTTYLAFPITEPEKEIEEGIETITVGD